MPSYKSPKALSLCVIALIGVLLSGCAHPPQPRPTQSDWTSQGSGAFHTDQGPVLQGVGLAEAMSNSSLLRAAADNRAKAQLAGVLDQYVKALIQLAGHDMQAPETSQAASAMVRQGLDRALITDHWFDEGNRKLYARCLLELAAFKHILGSTPISGVADASLADRADHMFEAFTAAEPKTR